MYDSINAIEFFKWLRLTHPLVQNADLYLKIYYFKYFKDKVMSEY